MALTVQDPVVGRVLDGRYRIVDRIAAGGMATVYRGIDIRLDRPVAVKLLHAGYAAAPAAVARFQREARAAARLSHPDVVSVFDQGGTEGEDPFLVMEYVSGGTLRDILRARGRLEPGEAVAIMDHVLAALTAAHREGLIHRDIKPENVLVTLDGRVKVADFGLARIAGDSTMTATGSVLFGTAAYLSPEQWSGSPLDARSDVYAAGILLFELLTGAVPYAGDSPHVVMRRHLEESVPAPSSLVAGLPPQFDHLVAWATRRDPNDRPGDAAEWHAALLATSRRLGLVPAVPALPEPVTERLSPASPTAGDAVPADGTAVMGPSGPLATTATPSPPQRRRHRVLLTTAAILLLTLAAAALGWWLAVGRYVHPPDVIGKTRAQAISALSAAGLTARWEPARFSPTVPLGTVAFESPTSAGRVVRHGAVDLALSRGPQELQVPDVRGQGRGEAVTALERLGLKVQVAPRGAYSPTVAKGHVVSTNPAADATVPAGTTVTLVVSKGRAPVSVADVTGKPVDQAESLLRAQGFNPHVTQAYNDTVHSGLVVSTTPRAGTAAPYGSQITIVESRGPQLFTVPSVQGQSVHDAIAAIRAAGFVPKLVAIFPAGPGRVVRESPSGGSREPRGTTVELDYF